MTTIQMRMSVTENTQLSDAQSRRIICAAAIGNGLIMYDFTVYSFSAVTIGHLFFPSDSALVSLLLSLATFGSGFLMRPLGALVIGNLADRKGRKTGLTASITLMTLGTGIIALVPTYASIGITAALFLVLARLMQGFAAGGEVGVSSVVLMEWADKKRRCYLTSWRGASQGGAALAGALVGACISAALKPESVQQWGWRIPFILGLLIGPVGWYLRRHMTETPVTSSYQASLKQVFAQHPRTLWLGILLMAAPTASGYIMVFYMPTYLVTVLHLPPIFSLLATCFSGTVILLGSLLLGKIGDRQPQRKPIQYVALLGSIVLIYPVFFALTHGVGLIASLLIIGGYAAVALTGGGSSSVMLLEAFPRHQRASGMSIAYSFGVVAFGGFSPFIVTWLIDATGNPMAPAWYLLAALCISLFALTRFPGVAHVDQED